jgi:hypothetical protein
MKIEKFKLRTALLIFAISVLTSQIILWAVNAATGQKVTQLSFMYLNIVNQLPVFVLGMLLFFWCGSGAGRSKATGATWWAM